MSVSMYWKPTDPDGEIYFAGTSTLKQILEDAFGPFPLMLSDKHIGKLEGIAACGYSSMHDLVSAINDHNCITITALY